MAKVVSVNVGLLLELAWRGKMVRTAIWKRPVDGRLYARRLNLVGDGQADLAAHGTGSRAAIFTSLQKSEKRSKFLRRVIAEEYWYLSKIVPPPYVFWNTYRPLSEAKPHSPAVAQTVGFALGKSKMFDLSTGVD
jgi:hypothetical protein